MGEVVISSLITGICGIVIAYIQVRQGKRLKRVENNVANRHATNLRDDIDALSESVKEILEGQRELRKDVRSLWADLRVERQERLGVEGRLDRLEGLLR